MAKSKKNTTVVTRKGGSTAEIASVTVTAPKPEKKKIREGFKISETPYDVVMPKGFNFKDYKPLKKKNFTTDALYFMHRAEEMNFKREAFLAKAEEAKKLGSSVKQRKIIKLQEKMDELKQQLEAQGVDVKALIAAATANKES